MSISVRQHSIVGSLNVNSRITCGHCVQCEEGMLVVQENTGEALTAKGDFMWMLPTIVRHQRTTSNSARDGDDF